MKAWDTLENRQVEIQAIKFHHLDGTPDTVVVDGKEWSARRFVMDKCAHANAGACSFCFDALQQENKRLREALDWFVSEAERAKKKGYDLTELALERCLANGKVALGGK